MFMLGSPETRHWVGDGISIPVQTDWLHIEMRAAKLASRTSYCQSCNDGCSTNMHPKKMNDMCKSFLEYTTNLD